jgi:solute carrier family 6 amino acid transporter-like protein 5/7/9/14
LRQLRPKRFFQHREQVWYQAVTQSFFSLSVGFGALINYSAHNKFRHNVYRDALIISITDTLTSLLAGTNVIKTYFVTVYVLAAP